MIMYTLHSNKCLICMEILTYKITYIKTYMHHLFDL